MTDRRDAGTPSQERLILSAQPAPLIGRTREVAFLRERLASGGARLVTLVGPGGTGKTRLAGELATALADDCPDGVCSVALTSVTDAKLVASTVAQALGIRETGGQTVEATLLGYARDRHMLIVLDNFEQVIGAAPVIAELLANAPRLAVVVTSRERLHLPDEYVFDVPPLALPRPDAVGGSAAAIEGYEAVQLFVQRARAVDSGFALTDANAAAVAEICARLDGLPLAIELAAARVSVLPPSALLRRLRHGIHVLGAAAFNLPARQQSLRGSISLSYNLLTPEEQQLFRRLSVFVGGCTAASVAAVSINATGGLLSLSDKSLLRQVQDTTGEPRYSMLETIREYALEQLKASGEFDTTQQRYGRSFVALAEAAEPGLTGPEQQRWLNRLDVEHDNLRAVLNWALDQGDGTTALRLSTSLWRFWHTRGYLSEGKTWLWAALNADTTTPPALRAKAYFAVAALAWAQCDYAHAQSAAETSLALRREMEDVPGIAACLNVLGLLYQDQGDHAAARGVLEESNALCRAMEDVRGIGVTLLNLGETARALGDYATARSLMEESLEALRSVGDTRYVGSALDYLGNVALEQHDYASAQALLRESLAVRWELHDMSGIARTLSGIARVIMRMDGNAASVTRAAHFLGLAQAVRESIGADVPINDRPQHARDLDAVRVGLAPDVFDAAWAEGRAMPLDRAIADALGHPTPATSGSA